MKVKDLKKGLGDREFDCLQEYLRAACGIDVMPDKRYLFETRLDGLLDAFGGSFTALCERLGADRALGRRVVERMTTGETSFFRDGHPFSTLRHQIFPRLAARRRKEAISMRPRLRVLCVGCASGEEPYSVAACLHAWLAMQDAFELRDVGVLAIDVSSRALEHARKALYHGQRLETLPAEYRGYFCRCGEKMTPLPALRGTVVFAQVNLVESLTSLGGFDVILCRNVIIYFSLEMRRRVIGQLFELLRPGGVLLLGASENLYRISDAFELVQLGATSYYEREQ